MGQDLRELLQNNLQDSLVNELSENHELRFLDKLNASFEKGTNTLVLKSQETKSNTVVIGSKIYDLKKSLSIAATLLVSVGLGIYFVNQTHQLQQSKTPVVYIKKQNANITPSLADVSPEFKQLEDNYLNTINVGLAQLKINDSNRNVVRSGISELEILKKEYQTILSGIQFGQIHPQILEALIYNLKMQVSVLKRLQQKVKSINEYSPSNAYQDLQT